MGKCSADNKKEKWIEHYSSSQKILLVGEGDFSFATCLAKAFGTAANMIATSLESKGIYHLPAIACMFAFFHLLF
jgi:25S rRNA (uracil2634-N3)-methyltransferase